MADRNERRGAAMPTGRVRRTAAPAALLLRSGAVAALTRARGLATRDATLRDALRDERLAKAATHAAEVMGGMKGAVMKIGQLLSFIDTELVPPAFQDALAALQADAPPMPPGLVDDVVLRELGARPDQIFEWFSPEPIAAASIGQVHMARLAEHDRELVVKVQYPGIAEAIATDLANGALLSALAGLVQTVLRDIIPQVDTKAMLEEIKERVGEELDYRIEAKNQQHFADLWRGHQKIQVPEVVHELSTERVLTMEYVDAMRWPAATQAPKEMRDAWGAAIVEFVFGSLYRHHVFNADPHPGNYLFHEDGTVTFLDFGCVRHFTPERVASIVRMRNAAVSGTDEEYIDALIAMGILREAPRDSSGLVAFARRDFSPLRAPQPFTYTKGWAADSLESMLDFRMGKDGPARQLNMPQDMVFLVRITAGLNSVLAGLGATVNFDELWPKILGDTA